VGKVLCVPERQGGSSSKLDTIESNTNHYLLNISRAFSFDVYSVENWKNVLISRKFFVNFIIKPFSRLWHGTLSFDSSPEIISKLQSPPTSFLEDSSKTNSTTRRFNHKLMLV